MCGIYGTTKSYPSEVVSAKLNTMKSRGPDFSGIKEFNSGVILGHNRLAILDLDSRSNQPFTYFGISVVFNGEIYNYRELKNELILLGYKFNTTSDTEVLCACYLEYGETCIERLNGMFAFVIYDKEKDCFFGARDRIGKKPLYYFLDNQHFEFASSLTALEYYSSLELEEESFIKYLYWNYIPDPFTPYKNVFKLPAGYKFSYKLSTKEMCIQQYWDIAPVSNINNDITFDQAKDTLKEILIGAVNRRMISDVPLGVFLSGGVDSSLITAVAQSQSNSPLKTFSIKFDEKEFDESVYAKQVAQYLGTEHTEIVCSQHETLDFIMNLSKYYDEPFADSSAIPTLLLSKHTKEKVTVALSGDGGDETFLGYNIYDQVYLKERIYKVPFILRKFFSSVFGLFSYSYKAKIYAAALSKKTIKDFYLAYYKKLNNDHIKYDEKEITYLNYLNNDKKSLFEAISDFDTKTYMNGDCITKVERASMAFSLEVRSPLMDFEIIEFSRKIPTAYKYQFGDGKKKILKALLYDYLPKEFFDRKKAGFGVPLGKWFRTILKDHVQHTLSIENLILIEKIIDVKECLKLVNDHLEGKWDHTSRIWNLMVLIDWLKRRNKRL